jgi:hypothetical protein
MTPAPLTPREAGALLHAAAEAIDAEMSGLPPAALRYHPAKGEWCVHEILGHLIETERRGFAGRIRIILDEDDPAFQGWDQNEVARARGDCEREGTALLAEFQRLRAESVTLVATLRPEHLARSGRHPKVGVLHIGDLLHEWVYHDRNHLRQMLANVQAFVWPHLANAQRFSSE